MTARHTALSLLDPVARICLAALFVSSGASKFGDLAGVAGAIGSKGFPVPMLLAALAALLEIAAGLALAVGFQTRAAAAALLAYTLIVTPLFHGFWGVAEAARGPESMQFMKNLWAVGGLALVVRAGAPAFGVDRWLSRRTAASPSPRNRPVATGRASL